MDTTVDGNTRSNGTTGSKEDKDHDIISPDVYARFLQRHEGIIRDEVTMLGFKAAIEANSKLFRGATVLEVNCGSGLLSLWVAQQGAARVIALEPSDVCQVARQLVRQNHLEHVIDVLQGNVEQLQHHLPQVDVIISKWMGACLMYSTALEEVLSARDKFLKPGGIIFPAIANLYITVAEQPRDPMALFSSPLQFWKSYYGCNLSHAWSIIERTPLVSFIDGNQMITQRHLLQRFDLHTLKRDGLSFTVPFKLRCLRQSLARYFVLYFDFRFPDSNYELKSIKVSTSPNAPDTQWKQTLFHIDEHLPICVNDIISGHLQVIRSPRHLDFDIAWSFKNNLTNIKLHTQIYRMQGNPVSI